VREVSPPNKRLKLAGVYRPNSVVVYPPSLSGPTQVERTVHHPEGSQGR